MTASRVLTQMYIVLRTADANLISGPILYLFTIPSFSTFSARLLPSCKHSQICWENGTKKVKEQYDKA